MGDGADEGVGNDSGSGWAGGVPTGAEEILDSSSEESEPCSDPCSGSCLCGVLSASGSCCTDGGGA